MAIETKMGQKQGGGGFWDKFQQGLGVVQSVAGIHNMIKNPATIAADPKIVADVADGKSVGDALSRRFDLRKSLIS